MSSRILDFLKNEVSDYIVTDIKRLALIRPEGEKGLGSCAIAEAMFLFAIMEYFGYLIRDDESNPKPNDTKGHLTQLFSNALVDLPEEYASRSEELVQLFRHGLMHQIFPKATGICKAGVNQPLFATFDGIDHLNVDRLGEDVLNMIEVLRTQLPGKSALCEQMSRRMDKVSATDFKQRDNIGQ